MKIDILTLFPQMFPPVFDESILKRAREKGAVELNVHNIRDYSLDPHHKVDDYGFGGGKGMVLMPEPIDRAIQDVKGSDGYVVMLTPQGIPYQQKIAYDLSEKKHLILLCGHYEGFDERIRSMVDLELSIGDYVLTGGELASMVIVDSVTRLLPGVIEEESHLNDSFHHNVLDYPVYTKPIDYKGMKVPEVLLSGHHENIRKWRYEQSILKTQQRRPDLLERDDSIENETLCDCKSKKTKCDSTIIQNKN